MSDKLTHLDDSGRARMVDVGAKPATQREATARGCVRMSEEAFALVMAGEAPKGEVRAAAEIAGVMAAKRTADLIPLCHPLPLTSIKVEVTPDRERLALVATATVKTTAPTGVEMEALTAVSITCLTIYDMLKAVDRTMAIGDIAVIAKHGGASGSYTRDGA
ncbi:MAG: cyclic pyranopterin monophosphate synthase MoaC [Hyphomonadaceae bacterium]